MSNNQDAPDESKPQRSFEESGDDEPIGLIEEFYYFITENKAWWMIPILVVFGLLALLVALAPTGAAPFIYSLF